MIAAGREEGREEGKKKKAEEIATNFLNDGIDISIISKNTGLSEKHIKSLKKQK